MIIRLGYDSVAGHERSELAYKYMIQRS